jgi:hypothetical protein
MTITELYLNKKIFLLIMFNYTISSYVCIEREPRRKEDSYIWTGIRIPVE